MKPLAWIVLLVGCTGDAPSGGIAIDAASSATVDAPAAQLDASPGVLTLTSAALTNGTFPDANTCTGPGNASPVLTWTGNALNAQSFVVTLTDPDANNLIHWAIYDIPNTATGLPATVQTAYTPNNVAGAHQAESFTTGVFGYQGPCPPQEHTYRFDLYAVDAAALPGTSTDTTRNQIATLAQSHMVAKASLMASYQRP